MEPPVLAVVLPCALAVVAGAAVQGVLGFGLALVAVPVLAWLAPSTVPVGILVAVLPLVVVAALRERAHLDVRGLAVALVGRVPGGAVGAAAVALLPVRGLQLAVAATVLAAVGLIAAGDLSQRRTRRRPGPPPAAEAVRPDAGPGVHGAARPDAGAGGAARPGAGVLVAAGVASGFGGTTAGIGGPPMALAYREAGGPRLRATLSAFFLVGSLLSLGMLAVAGEVTADGLAAGAALVPAVGVGYALAEPLRHRLRRRGVREAVLAFSTVAATGLAVQALTA
ncbi:MAG: TSUP family transporter [Kineosporiaceae bacterium]